MSKPSTPTSILHSPFSILHSPLLVVLLCAVAIVPLLRSQAPCTHDGALHYYRVAAMRHALQNGILFTRYLPDLAFGYGYPFFNYREPLSYYLLLGLHLTGLPLPVALNLVYVLSIVGSALAAYLLARDLFGPLAGILAAVAYAYAPYQFLDALLRANMPESVALPLLPLALWAFRRLALTGRRRWFLASVATLTALYLTHNISSLLFTPLLLAYLGLLWLVHRRGGHWVATGSALVLAFGLAAFFWGPALLEQDYAQLFMSRVTRNNDFHYNFVSLAEIFAPPAPVDTSLMNPPMRIHLGLVQAILAGVGLIVGLVRWRDRERRATLVFLALAAVAMLWMSTRASLWLWERLPLISFVQFPWRLIGRAALPIAVLASATASSDCGLRTANCGLRIANCASQNTDHATRNAQHISRFTFHASRFTFHASRFTFHVSRFTHYALRITYYLLISLLILSALPSTYPPHGYCPNAPRPTIRDVFAYEHRSTLVGVDPEGSYFPVWVKRRPSGSPLEEQYATGGLVTRFDESTLPAGASVVEAGYGPNRADLVVETPAPFRARYLAFYFPGWQVHIDGKVVQVAATDPDGLITFEVPAGHHAIAIRFGSTPVRTAFTILSLLALVAIFIITLRYPQIPNPQSAIPNPQSPIPNPQSAIPNPWPLAAIALLLLIFKLAVVDRLETPFRRPTLQPDGTLPGVEHPLDQPYADGLMLIGYNQAIGYDQERATIPADGTLRLDLVWTAYAPPTARYQTVAHLVGLDGLRWSQPDSFRPRGYANYPPTPTWRPGRYALDSHEVEPLPGTPPGTYEVVLTAFNRATLAPLSILNEQGQPAAPSLTLGQVTLTRPRQPVTPPADGRIDLPLGDFTLLTADFDRAQAAPGDAVHATLLWRAERDGEASTCGTCTAALFLLAPGGSAASTYPVLPAAAWRAGDVLRSQHRLTLPATLGSGIYTWTIGLAASSVRPVASLCIVAPAHVFTPPSFRQPVGVVLGNLATLTGFDLAPSTGGEPIIHPGDALTVTLIWRAEGTAASSYHVFLHLLDPEGKLVAQSDGVPSNWTRPTTGWLPGEYVVDPRTLVIPPGARAGDYTLQAGLYIPGGRRLTASDGADAATLATIKVNAQ